MLVPIERTAEIPMSSHTEPWPVKNSIAKTSVDNAITPSDTMMRVFLLYLSAHTPAKGESKRFGRNPKMIDSVIIIPDWVSRAMYQVIANCTIEEPNSDTVWLDRKRAVFFLQFFVVFSKVFASSFRDLFVYI